MHPLFDPARRLAAGLAGLPWASVDTGSTGRSAANAMPYTYNPLESKYYGAIVRGKPARWAYHDPRPCLLPPDWSGGYTSIFAVQQEEDWNKERKVAAGGMM